MTTAAVVRHAICGLLTAGAVATSGAAPPGGVDLSVGATSRIVVIDNADAGDLGGTAERLHNYGSASLVRFHGALPAELANRVHRLPESDAVSFRSWSGRIGATDVPPAGAIGLWVVRLVGPLDRRWRTDLEDRGLEVLASAHPHALVVRSRPDSLAAALSVTTSEGLPAVIGVVPLPDEARVHRSLRPALLGREAVDVELRAFDFAFRPVAIDDKAVSTAGGLRPLLADRPEIGYVEPVFAKQLHNNLAASPELIGAHQLWVHGALGSDVIVLHNDSGVDVEHPALVDSVMASIGRMEYADTAHGTHTAGSIVGRPAERAPHNTSGCGDTIAGLATAGGMAPDARLVTNNVFRDGLLEIPDMMAWGAGHGAQLSNNSWGLLGQTGPELGYSAAAVEVDGAVRDADPGTDGAQPMAIFFSAGNTGPEAGTVTSPGTAKNAITIGAVENARCGAWVPSHQPGPAPNLVVESSGRGPSQGRVKPDLVAPGSDVLSLESRDDYAVQPWDQDWTGTVHALNTGTSQACALATGTGALVHEVLWRRMPSSGRRPSPALLKATLIATADRLGDAASLDHGWGRIDVTGWLDSGLRILSWDQDETTELATGSSWSTTIAVLSADRPVDLAMVWTDPPGEADADHPLVNDLDLVVTSPSGTVFRGTIFDGAWSRPDPGEDRDIDNNLEVVRVEAPEAGVWSVRVVGVDVPQTPDGLDGQDFALVATGDVGHCSDPPPPPATVEASPSGPNAIRVQWSAVSGATRYQVARATRSGGLPYEVVANVPAGVTSIVDEGLSGSSTYFYVVRAWWGCWSVDGPEASATATGPCTNLPAFGGLESVTPVASAGCSLELSWTPAVASCPAAVAYDIYRGEEPDFAPTDDTRIFDRLVSDRFVDRGLDPNREYTYIVRAFNLPGGGDDGNTVRVGARTVGSDDEYLDPATAAQTFPWTRKPGSTADSGTEPWRRTDHDAWLGGLSWFADDEPRTKDQVLELREPIELADDVPLRLEFRHRLRLDRGRDGGRLEYSTNGGRDWFDILSGDGQTIRDDPDRIVSGGYTDTIAATANPLYLEDAWSGDSEGWVHTVVDLDDFTGLRLLLRWRFAGDDTPGLDWGWWVDAIRMFVERPCQSCVPADPPMWVSAQATADGIEVGWSNFPPASSYRVERSIHPAGPRELVATVASPATTYLDTDVSGGTTYRYVVRSGEGCVSDPSATATAMATGPCTRAPDFWGLDEVVDRRAPGCALDLEWRPADPGCAGGAPRYRVYRSADPTFDPGPATLLVDGVAGTRYRDLELVDRELVHYRVRAVDGISGMEESNPVVHEASTTGPEELLFADSVEDGPDGWWTALGSGADTGTDPWRVVDDRTFDGERAWFCANEPRVKDQVVGLLEPLEIVEPATVLAFHHLFDLEPFWDGGRLEYSTDGGATWHDILAGDGDSVGDNPSRFLRGGYSGFVSAGTGHPFAGEPAWTGWVDGWLETIVDLDDLVGLTVSFRWRLGCDRSDARVGWWLDDLRLVHTTPCETVVAPPPRPGGARRP